MAGRLSFSIAINLLTDQFKRGANQVKSAFDKMKSQVLGFAAVLGIGGMGLKNFINSTAEFEASVSKLSAILGTTPGKIKALTDNAKKLGETTKYTAAEAANLQIELAKLGFTRNEILQTTESVLKFAQATDTGLAEAAALAGASLRMFGAEASESKRYVSAMSIATTKSALSFTYLATALPIVGPVAKAFNFTIEDTLALMGKLADSGFDASSAATATRNILLNLADGSGALAKTLGSPVKTLPQLISGLQKLKDKGVDLNATLKLTDKRSVAAFNAFLESADKITPLREAITNVEGDLDQMAGTMGNNVKGALAGLSSAWESLMIKLSETTNTPLKNLINGITSVLRDIKAGFAGLVAFVITLISGKLLQSIIGYFGQYWNFINTTVNKAKVAEEQKLLATKNRTAAEIAYMKTVNDYQKFSNGVRKASDADVRKAEKALNAASLAEKKAINAAKVASEKAAALQTTSVWGKTAKSIKLAFAGLFTTVKGLLAAAWPMALITGIGLVIGKLVNMRKEANRIKNIFSEYQKTLWSSGNTAEVVRMQTLAKIMNDRRKSQKEINTAQSELQRMLGKENLSQEELNKQVLKRVSLLRQAAMAEAAFTTVGEYTEKNEKLAGTIGLSPEQLKRLANLYAGKDTNKQNHDYYYQTMGRMYSDNGVKGAYDATGTDKVVNEFVQNLRVITDATNRAGRYSEAAQKIIADDDGGVTVPDKEKTPLQKQQESYNKQFSELGAELEIGKITQAEYNKSLGELNIKMYAQAKGTNDKEVLESEYLKTRKKAAEEAIKNQDKNAALVELEKVQKEYNEKVKDNQTQFAKNLISEKEMNDNIASLSIEAAKSAAGIKGIGDEADMFITAMQLNARLLASQARIKPRDTTFDYKKTKVDIASENLDKAKELANKYKEDARVIGQTLSDEVANAMARVPSLEEALKLAQVREDIKDFSRELGDMKWDFAKGIVSNIDGIVSAFQRLKDAFDPEQEATEWEKLMAIWNAFSSVVDGILSVAKTIENITELTNKLTKAKETEAIIDTATTTTKVTNAVTGAAATVSAAAIEKTAATTEVAANTAKGASAAGSSAAKLPFPANIIAIGGAIAAAIALFSAIPKFAKGGIISGGPSSGDKILARVNAGEMILNQGQQSRLFEAINSGKLGGSGSSNLSSTVTTRVRAKDIILTINNELKSQGKKPIS